MDGKKTFKSATQVSENMRKFADFISKKPINIPKSKLNGSPKYLEKLKTNRKN